MNAETEAMDETHNKKGRHRKKHLYAMILKQMEFYFSDSNLNKDRFLGQILETSEFVTIETFLKFNKIHKLTTSVLDIVKAIKKSDFLEISADETQVKRKTPVKIKEDIEESTIYVQHLKPDTTHEWLSNIFSEFGKVVYVSIPKYKQNRLNKGFAFVEFDCEAEANKTIDYFESIGCKISSQIAPEELCSVATFEGDSDQVTNRFNNKNNVSDLIGEEAADNNKRKLCELSEVMAEPPNKKIKTNECVVEVELISDDRKDKKKLKKRKAYFKELGLQMLPKKEWKKMRNRYLEMQRGKMQQLKTHLLKKQFVVNKQEIKDEKLSFVSGVIVKIKFVETVDVKKVKSEIKALSVDAKYIDFPCTVNNDECFVRFTNAENCKQFVGSNYKGASLVVLDGEEEKEYWGKIQSEREAKFNKEVKKQSRGRDKLLKKAERELGKHIRFDDVN